MEKVLGDKGPFKHNPFYGSMKMGIGFNKKTVQTAVLNFPMLVPPQPNLIPLFLTSGPSPKCPITIFIYSQNSLQTFHKELYAHTHTRQISNNQFAFSCVADGKLASSFLISYKILVEPSKGLTHLFNGPSVSDLRAQVFAVVCYLLFSLGLVYLGV